KTAKPLSTMRELVVDPDVAKNYLGSSFHLGRNFGAGTKPPRLLGLDQQLSKPPLTAKAYLRRHDLKFDILRLDGVNAHRLCLIVNILDLIDAMSLLQRKARGLVFDESSHWPRTQMRGLPISA